ncbi:MAG: tRNA (guanosine(46)-N7)-methyltransferase TrmB [Clostridiales bacterium]|nr:tRNA (guanosine(46)-N7)-methyltransferase TrmB [Candidatus Apopatocola equi]MCQ2439710.1 tRNA (guanosine(46)-N7)-methyltransferase TrmB [Oscillospiraceae bacterium]
MRKKPNLVPRMERCAALQIMEPEALKGRWHEEFPQYKSIRLEIGCGKGRFTCEQALREPEILLIAIEKVQDAMVVAEERALAQEIPNLRFIDFDAEKLTDIFAAGEIERIYINFPDPWRKTRQYKRRLSAPAFLERYTVVLPPDGEVWFKTDNEPLFQWSMESFAASGWAVREMPEGTPMTDYELKFTEQGIPIHRVIASVPVRKEQDA